MKFNVTYEIWGEADAEAGDTDRRGFISEDTDLRSAVTDLFETRTAHCSGIECVEPNCCRPDFQNARWITAYNGMEFLTGDRESRSLHFPESMTPASRARLCKLLMGA